MPLTAEEIEKHVKKHLNAESAAKMTPENALELLDAQMTALSLIAIDQGKELEKAQTKSLDRLEIDPDVLELSAKLTQVKLEGLVASGAVSPVCAKALSAVLIGTKEKRNVYGLSRKATGGADPLADLIMDALKDNKPVKLGERTGAQQKTIALARTDEQADESYRKKVTDIMTAVVSK